ncbi:MAG: hypothetical protein WHU54_08945 [Candidatus Bathyarchaeia archaeon]
MKVYCVGETLNEVAFSRYCSKYFVIPQIEHDLKILQSFLSTFAAQVSGQIIIFPASDLFCLAISNICDYLDKKYLCSSNPRSVKTLVDKALFAKSLVNSQLAHPATLIVALDQVDMVARDLTYPVLIKPTITQNFWMFNVKSFVAENYFELKTYIAQVRKYRISVVLQEVVPGPQSNVYGLAGYIDKDHQLKGLFAYRRIRGWPLDFGCNSLIESIPIKQVEGVTCSLLDYLRKIKYYGLFEAEFKRDARDDVFKLIEINARPWWQNFFPTACGLNLVLIAFLDSVGLKVPFNKNYRAGLKWVHFFNDICSAITLFHNGELGLFDWLFSYSNVKDFAYFNVKDLLPFIATPFFVCPSYALAFMQKIWNKLGMAFGKYLP